MAVRAEEEQAERHRVEVAPVAGVQEAEVRVQASR